MKFRAKLKSLTRIVRNYTPRKLAITLLAVAAVAVPAAIFATTSGGAPTFTWNAPAPYVYFNSITDNPHWPGGNEQQSTKIIDASGNAVNSVNVQDGQTYTVEMLVHNDASLNLNLKAADVWGGLVYKDTTAVPAQSQTVTGVVRASNCGLSPSGNLGAVCQFTSQVAFNSANNFKLSYVPGTAQYTTQFTGADYTQGGTVFQLPDSTINTGTSLGVTSMDGNIPGCWPHHGILTAKFTVKTETPPPAPKPSYDVAKTVSQSGNTLNYNLTATNTGDTDLTNVKLHDNLTRNNANGAPTNVNLPAGVTGTYPDFTIAKLAAGQSVSISYTINASVANITNKCGDNSGSVANTVSSTNDQQINESNANNNSTSSNITQNDNSGCVQPAPSYNLTKTVDKTSAKPGDTLNYILTFVNSGNTDLTNVVIKDQFPNGQLTLVGKLDANVTNGNGITNLANLFTSGVNVATVHAGGKVVITFSATVNNTIIDTNNCQGGWANVVNKSLATTSQDQTETNLNDNNTTTAVTVPNTCKPNFDIVKTVDKTTAKPGDTLTYTLTFKNSGNQALSNATMADKLPAGVTLVPNSLSVSNNLSHTGDLFNNQMVVAGPIAPGVSFTVTYKVTINQDIALVCGNNSLVNIVASGTSELVKEPNISNNSATTNVAKDCTPPPTTKPCPTNPALPIDSDQCKPCPTDSSMNYDNPNCKPVTPPTVTPPAPQSYMPAQIAATGPTEVMAGLLAAGALTFGSVAYLNSRRALKANLRK